MSNISPIDYGGPVQADTSGVEATQQAQAVKHQFESGVVQSAGENVGTGADTFMRAIVQRQALTATAAQDKTAADTIDFIKRNPTVKLSDLESFMGVEATQNLTQDSNVKSLLHLAGVDGYGRDTNLPMHAIGKPLYEMRTSAGRAEAAQNIALPGWRNQWMLHAQAEDTNKAALHVNPELARQAVAEGREQTLLALDSQVASARVPDDIQKAIAGVDHAAYLSYPERKVLHERYSKEMDKFEGNQAMNSDDPLEMEKELKKFADPETNYPHMNPDERTHFKNEVTGRMHAALAFDEAQERLKVRAEKKSDNEFEGTLLRRFAAGDPPSASEIALPQSDDAPVGQRGFHDNEDGNAKLKSMLEYLTTYNKSLEEPRPISDPIALGMLNEMYLKDPDKFNAAMSHVGSPITIPGIMRNGKPYEVDFGGDLSIADQHGFLEKHNKLTGDPLDVRTQEQHTAEAGMNAKVEGITREVFQSDTNLFLNTPASIGNRAIIRMRMENALSQAKKDKVAGGGQAYLSPEEETTAMRTVAQNIKNNPPEHWYTGDPNTTGSPVVKLPDGSEHVVTGGEDDAFRMAAAAYKLPISRIDSSQYKEHMEAYFGWKNRLDTAFQGVFQNRPTDAQSFNMYFRLQHDSRAMEQTQGFKDVVKAAGPRAGEDYLVKRIAIRMANEAKLTAGKNGQ